MSSDDSPGDPIRQLEIQAAQDQIKERIVAFLKERGVDLSPGPELPDEASYAERYLRDPPEYCQAWDPEARLNAAAEDAAKEYREVMRYRMSMLDIERDIAFMTMLIYIRQRYSGNRPAAELMADQADSRRILMYNLWKEGRWSGAWKQLVDQEFPGDELTETDLAQFAADREAEQAEIARRKASEVLPYEMAYAFMESQGVVLSAKDSAKLLAMMMLVEIEPLVRNTPSSMMDKRMLAFQIIGDSIDSHPAWRELLEQYFPLPAET